MFLTIVLIPAPIAEPIPEATCSRKPLFNNALSKAVAALTANATANNGVSLPKVLLKKEGETRDVKAAVTPKEINAANCGESAVNASKAFLAPLPIASITDPANSLPASTLALALILNLSNLNCI